jgi:hypothetical protein
MYPLHYRNFGTHESMASCHTLYDGELHYLRWYEFRKDTGEWHIHQSGNFMPDSLSRYMPSLSMNGNGDMAMGYTKSGLEKNPSIWLTGRKADDPLGVMSFQEIELYQGLNYVNNYSSSQNRNRWGDYASMMVDPVNDSTFWFTSMYPVEADNPGNWSTKIFAFNLNDVNNEPVAYAGADTVICMDEMFFTRANAENFSALLWGTDGDGHFTSDHSLKARYTRGYQDMENGQVNLHLSLEGHVPGTQDSDTMTLYINKYPEVEAGLDDTICCNHSFSLQGQVLFSDGQYWTSNGSGIFNDSTLLDAIYTPALCDTGMDHVTLTLHAEPLAPCTGMKMDSLALIVRSCLGIEEYAGSIVNMHTYPNPVRGEMHLQAFFRENTSVRIQIISNSGKTIFQGTYPTVNHKLTKVFDFSHLPDGVYYVRLRAGESSAVRKVIITN